MQNKDSSVHCSQHAAVHKNSTEFELSALGKVPPMGPSVPAAKWSSNLGLPACFSLSYQ